MKFIILCGGIGKRNNNYSLPKPLNYIKGRHMIEYVIENIPSNQIYIIYNHFLDTYHFKEIIINKFKKKRFYFSKVDYLTRGAIETAYVGLQNFGSEELESFQNENIMFIDNDNLHQFPTIPDFNTHFVGYSIDHLKDNYSFIQTNEDNQVIKIIEKEKISDFFCCGLYGFKNRDSFLKEAKLLLLKNSKIKNEFYFSRLYQELLKKDHKIETLYIQKVTHLGSKKEILLHQNNHLYTKKMRICFDLDNTLVTYPTIPYDYSSVKPIPKMIDLLKELKEQGHEIIIHTARRMLTHQHNIGKVIKDIAMVTLTTLQEFQIPYDEIIFGKPIADIYIDDRSINPYINDISYFGIFLNQNEEIPYNLSLNKHNLIQKKGSIISKKGPEFFLNGELYFYQHYPEEIKNYFPILLNYNKNEDFIELHLDYIEGIPLFYIYKNELLSETMIDSLLKMIDKLHTTEGQINIDMENIKNNYFKKLKDRFNPEDYNFKDAEILLNEILEGLDKHFSAEIVPVIHGDLWFSNIILTYNDQFKLLDMKGEVDKILTLNGDKYYDYGKILQSIIGLDLLINQEDYSKDYILKMKTYFLNKCYQLGLNIDYLKYVTKSLIFGIFHCLPEDKKYLKPKIIDLIKKI